MKGDHGWLVKGEAFAVFCRQYSEAIDYLPSFFDSHKEEFLFAHGIKTGLFRSPAWLLLLRSTKNITRKKIRENWPYIVKTIKRLRKLYFFLLFPPKILTFIRNILKKTPLLNFLRRK
jgi:hypothetical protein